MSAKVFNSLAKSLAEAGQILRGDVTEFRSFIRSTESNQKAAKALAVCLSTDDGNLLIVGKIYEVKILKNHFAVKDENGETVICPPDDFLILSFSPNAEKKLRQSIRV